MDTGFPRAGRGRVSENGRLSRWGEFWFRWWSWWRVSGLHDGQGLWGGLLGRVWGGEG